MNDEALRRLVEERWTALRAEQTTGERRLRVAPVPLTTEGGSPAAAVDHEGRLHLLLPIDTHRKIRTDPAGPVIQLRKRALEGEEIYQTYADLACLRDEFDDLFTELCVDVLAAVEGLPENPVKALYRVLDRWKALFRTLTPPLKSEQLAGLFGELLVLNRLLERDPSAHRFWRGPDGHHHDFSTGFTAIEVKSSIATEGRRPRIHGLNQLETPEGGTLCLVWFRLRRTAAGGAGTSFVEAVDHALRLCDDETSLLELLARAGYRPSDADRYHDVVFVVGEERWYGVDAGFPGLTARALHAAGVPLSALDVEYTIDLSGEFPAPLRHGRVEQLIDSMIQESV